MGLAMSHTHTCCWLSSPLVITSTTKPTQMAKKSTEKKTATEKKEKGGDKKGKHAKDKSSDDHAGQAKGVRCVPSVQRSCIDIIAV